MMLRTEVTDTPTPTFGALAGDPDISPARVLPGEAQDKLDRLSRQPGALGPMALGPASANRFPMPAQQGSRCDEEDPQRSLGNSLANINRISRSESW
jgi:hypothetical protein